MFYFMTNSSVVIQFIIIIFFTTGPHIYIHSINKLLDLICFHFLLYFVVVVVVTTFIRKTASRHHFHIIIFCCDYDEFISTCLFDGFVFFSCY